MKRLRRFEQAKNFLYSCMMRGSVGAPYKMADVKFAMGHILELWAKEVKDKDKLDAAREHYAEAYDEIFSAAKKKSLASKKKKPTYDDWIHSHQCWVSFAETCCVASDFLLAVDYFKKAIDCMEKVNKKTPGKVAGKACAKVWFSLAKCQMRR